MWWMLIFPIALTAYLFYEKKIEETPWPIYFAPITLSCLVIWLSSLLADYISTWATEYHGGHIVGASWDEHWTETYYVTVEDYSTDSKGNRVVSGSHQEARTTYHPDSYIAKDSNEYEISIDGDKFEALCEKFHDRKRESVWRSGQSSWGDGRRFVSHWDGGNPTYTPAFTSHRYENRVVASHSIFNFKNIDPKKSRVYEYPPIYDFFHQDSIVGIENGEAERSITDFNSRFGSVKQLRLFIVVFHNRTIEAGEAQQHYWKNGNKNEVVVTIGTSNDKIDWVYPFCWGNERLKIDLREDISELKEFDINKVIDISKNLSFKEFERMSFAKFKYLSVDTPLWTKFLCFFLVVGVNVWILTYLK